MNEPKLTEKAGPWVDLGLTLPVFIAYHVGVVFLRMQNATDMVTGPLLRLAEGSRGAYVALTVGGGAVFAGVLSVLGRGQTFQASKFLQTGLEGVLYAVLMRLAGSWVVMHLPAGTMNGPDPFSGFILSLGAGFYEELAFRVTLFGLGAKLLIWLYAPKGSAKVREVVVKLVWALVAAALFSGMHYIGALGDVFELRSFVFRWVLGLALTLIFATRGFAAAVWSHALYDVWVLVLPG